MWEMWGVEISAFPLTWHIAYTTACCYRTSVSLKSREGAKHITSPTSKSDRTCPLDCAACDQRSSGPLRGGKGWKFSWARLRLGPPLSHKNIFALCLKAELIIWIELTSGISYFQQIRLGILARSPDTNPCRASAHENVSRDYRMVRTTPLKYTVDDSY